jgi:CheY-like chemotaxis protein
VRPTTEPPPPLPCSRPILVVDDDADVRRLMTRIFQAYAGHDVTEADSGYEALRSLYTAQQLPCVIVLDLMMRGMSGLDVIGELRRQRSFASIPVVIVTAATDVGSLAHTHARRIIKKPFARLELMVGVQELCRASRAASAAEACTLGATSTPLPGMRQSGTWRTLSSVSPPAPASIRAYRR